MRRDTPSADIDGVDTYVAVAEDMHLAGDELTSYVSVRTRAEIEWLRMLAEWCQDQAERLTADLDRAVAAS